MRRVASNTSARRPRGSEFLIETLPWGTSGSSSKRGIGQAILTAKIEEDKIVDWPMVYILTNDDEAYVGQTKSALHRMDQHGANREKAAFEEATLIYCDEFNMSVITNYEHRLIQLMSAEGIFQLTNKNEGMQDGNYFSKEEYDLMFNDLWDDLRAHGLPNGKRLARKSIPEIEESELFKYSPFKSLNRQQEDALDRILEAIRDRADSPGPVVVEGMPGTGKTVLAVYLLKMLKEMDEFKDANIRLVEPVPSLRKTLQRVLRTVGGLKSVDVIGPGDVAKAKYGFKQGGEKCFDVLLIDEAHRLKQYRNIVNRGQFKKTSAVLGLDYETCSEIDWLISQAVIPVFFYDPWQTVRPSSPSESQFMSAVGRAAEKSISLTEQMRCGGGKEYLDYVRDIIWGSGPEHRQFENYAFELHENFSEFHELFEQTLASNNLTRLIAGFAWPWATKGKAGIPPEVYDIEIEGCRLKWNCVQEGWVDKGCEDSGVAGEVGCIHTIQGYDLSNAFVIIGPDFKFDSASGKPTVDRDCYFDKNGKTGTEDDELLNYLRNIYYVLLTRGIESTHVYVCDEALREYFRQFF